MGLKLPFPKWLANIPIEVWFEGINTDGDLEENIIFNGKCIYTDKSKQILNAERQLITLSGKVVIEGSIYDELFQGYVKINGVKKKIYSIERPLNPDGSIFSTELNLI
ncbi:hypothetical protein [Terrisporobacter mayombei]|uniref:hypothetical protein n=1 Tax=Terrisporobacter mayombei TaxID=1541 RepID=UPI00265885C4|nr:hypothetical protein [Terrisporobacter mayombei]MCC3668041.1 hypothetical protein [Terrisporobacter mayombei]